MGPHLIEPMSFIFVFHVGQEQCFIFYFLPFSVPILKVISLD